MFRAVYRSSSGALTVFAASGLHTRVVTGRSQDWVGDYGQSPHAYVNQRLQIQLEFLMISGTPRETCWAFNERWNNKFCYKVASCWLFLLNHTAMHGSVNIKLILLLCMSLTWLAATQTEHHFGRIMTITVDVNQQIRTGSVLFWKSSHSWFRAS